MIKAALYGVVIPLVIFGSFAAHNGNITETIWYCYCIHIGLWFVERCGNDGTNH